MRLSPLFLAPPISTFYGQHHPEYSWKELSELAKHPEQTVPAGPGTLLARQQPLLEDLPPYTISLPLDHKGETNRTFNNQFWINATYYEPGGPVIFLDIGESDGQSTAEAYLLEMDAPTAVMRLARHYKGIAIAWEHRFYGESFPSNSSKKFSPEWKYHTVQQALDDVVVFANTFANTTSSSPDPSNPFETYAVHPSKTPWIAVSGSYPGARIAFLREKHPEIIYAAWGSSTCSGGEVRSPGYYTMIQSNLPANCSADWAAIRKYVDEQLNDGSSAALAKLRFGGDDEVEVLAIAAGGFQTLGREYTTDLFCNEYETLGGRRSASPRGLVAELGIEVAYKEYADLLEPLYRQYLRSRDRFQDDPTSESWLFQECTELGGFRVHDPDNPNSFISSLVTEESIMEICREKFGSSLLPERPNVAALNDLGGWDVNPSNFLFTDGQFDPWRIVTPSWPNKPGIVRTPAEVIPKCNVRPPLDRYYGKVYPNTVHMPEYKVGISRALALGPSAVAQNEKIFDTSLELFQKALDQWLPCFGKEAPGHVGDGAPVGRAGVPAGGASLLEVKTSVVALWPLVVVASLYVFV